MLRLYIIGLSILVVAIIANAVIMKIGLKSWYEFLSSLATNGLVIFSKISFLDYLWLFIGYPMVLGLGYMIGDKIYTYFF